MDDSSSSLAYSATQLLERTDEMSESQTSETVKRKQVGVLIIKDKEHPIYTGVNTIGRHISNQIVVKDASVSKHHAEIEGRKQLCFLTDLKSLNGSFDRFKGKFLPNRGYELINGSTIKFGQIEATLKHFFTDGNLMRTPINMRINKIIASTPESVLVNIGSPRMSMLNIQVEKPLKKRALRTSENKEEMGKNKRAKKDENFDDDSLKSKGRPKKNTNSDNSSNSVINDSEEISNEVKKSFKITIKPKRTRNKKTKEPTIDVLNSSSSIMDDSEENLNSIQVKGENSKRTRTKRTIKDATIDIPNSSNSMADDSEITNSNPIKTKIPINSKIKKTRTLKEAAIDVPNSSNSMADDLEEISNSNPIPVNSKIKKTRTPKEAAINLPNSSNSTADDLEELPNSNSIKTKIPQNSKITRTRKQKSTVNSSNSIVEDSEDSEEIPNSNQIKANIPINQKRTRTKKTNDISNSLSSTNEESKEILKLPTKRRTRKNTNDISINSSSSMNENVADVSNLNQTKEISKLPIINKKPRITKKGKIDTISNNTSSNSLVDNTLSESSLSEKIIEPKKTRGRKPKNQGENSKLENLSTNSSILSLADSDLNSSTASTSSRAKRSRFSSPSKHKVLFTGIAVKDYQKHLTKLGLQETEDINKCTILVTDKVRRTFKFLCALSRGIPILSVKWIMDSAKKSKIQVLDDYIINDSIAENKFQFNLKESLQKAKDKKMLDGWTIVLTPNITAPPVDELKEMVIACGGKALLRSPTKWTNDMIIISHEQDYENAKKFMTKAPKTVQLHSTEFLLTGILKQEINLKNYLLKIT